MVLEIINVIAIILIPIVAVLIGQWLQNKSEKRKDKMRVFSHLMSYRAIGYTDKESVNILNSIPIIFHKDKKVIEKFNEYMSSLNIKPEDYSQKQKEIDDNKTKLLVEMAKVLKYKNVNWEIIQNPYLPTGLLKQMQQEAIFKQGQLSMASMITNMKENQETQNKNKKAKK